MVCLCPYDLGGGGGGQINAALNYCHILRVVHSQ